MSATPTPADKSNTAIFGWPTWVKNIPFILMHLACFMVFLPNVYATPTALALCFGFYFIRMFGITAGYHRYFSHRAYKTSRFFQFVMAWLGCSAMQKGPLWWASHHRHHHLHSDQEEDVHSPHVDSLWWSHIGWVLSKDYVHTDWNAIRDFSKYPELQWLDRNHWVPGLVTAIISYLVAGMSGLVWGFFVSTVITYHATFCINSFCHIIGNVRFKTTDKSKNSALMALITLGEGWHNNHHHYQSSANQGFYWWEFDISYSVLKLLSWCGLVWDLRGVPEHKRVPTVQQPTVEPVATPVAVEPQPVISPILASIQGPADSVMQSLTHAAELAAQAATSAKHAIDATQSPTQTLSHAAEIAAEKARLAYQALTHAAENASQAASSIKESASQAAHSASVTLSQAFEAAASVAHQVSQSAGQALTSAKEAASYAADSAMQAAIQAAHSASQAWSNAAEALRQAASTLNAKVATAAIAAAPMAAIAAEVATRSTSGA